MNKLILVALSLLLLQGCFLKENPINSSMKGDGFLKEILKNKENYEIQIIYTEIKRDKEGEPDFMDFEEAGVKTEEYVEAVKGKKKEYEHPESVDALFG